MAGGPDPSNPGTYCQVSALAETDANTPAITATLMAVIVERFLDLTVIGKAAAWLLVRLTLTAPLLILFSFFMAFLLFLQLSDCLRLSLSMGKRSGKVSRYFAAKTRLMLSAKNP